ncbi:MAG: (d)CMP kinase [Candidatus Omnitrophica bacterium]|nr:(d)CMP kinase [Candidatus Omnitrophota bacterium]
MPTSGRPKKLIVAIDGPAGSGKSSTAKALAKRLKIPYIDTGAMYRAVTLQAMRDGVPFTDKKKLAAIAKKARIELKGSDPEKQRVFLDGKEITKAIRFPELTKNVFHVAQLPLVRKEMVKKQRLMGKRGGAVMEGRDIGTVVFPKADLKLYFEATPEIRARRRYKELLRDGIRVDFKTVMKDIQGRDATDFHRKNSPLRRAEDAVLMDTSSLTIEETVDKILAIIRSNSLDGFKLGKRDRR